MRLPCGYLPCTSGDECMTFKGVFELTFSAKGYKTVTIPFHPMCKETIEALKLVKMEKIE